MRAQQEETANTFVSLDRSLSEVADEHAILRAEELIFCRRRAAIPTAKATAGARVARKQAAASTTERSTAPSRTGGDVQKSLERKFISRSPSTLRSPSPSDNCFFHSGRTVAESTPGAAIVRELSWPHSRQKPGRVGEVEGGAASFAAITIDTLRTGADAGGCRSAEDVSCPSVHGSANSFVHGSTSSSPSGSPCNTSHLPTERVATGLFGPTAGTTPSSTVTKGTKKRSHAGSHGDTGGSRYFFRPGSPSDSLGASTCAQMEAKPDPSSFKNVAANNTTSGGVHKFTRRFSVGHGIRRRASMLLSSPRAKKISPRSPEITSPAEAEDGAAASGHSSGFDEGENVEAAAAGRTGPTNLIVVNGLRLVWTLEIRDSVVRAGLGRIID